jgi:HSP20 family protein
MLLYPSTTLGRDPFLGMRRLQDEFDRAFAPFFSETSSGAYPAVNLWQGENSVAITTELPGVEPEEIEISVKDDTLTLSGERKMSDVGDKVTWHMRERPFGRFARSIRLPFRVDPETVEARFTNGVLQVEMQRPEEDRPRRIKVKAA